MRATLFGLLALTGCYSSRNVDCAVRCGTGAQPCADGYRCDGTTGLCVGNDFAGTCASGPGDDGGGGGEAPSACSTERMIVMLDPNDPVPTGWTCVSCTAGDKLFQTFVVGSDAFGAQGGKLTHAHAYDLPQVTLASSTADIGGSGNGAVGGGVHAATVGNMTSFESNVPPFRDLLMIKPLGPITELPRGAIIMIDGPALQGGAFVRYAIQDGQFIRAGGSAISGGLPTHTHTFGTILPLTDPTGAVLGTGSIPAATQHQHVISGSLPAFSNDPSHVVIGLEQVTAPTPLPPNALAFFDAAPAAPWTVVSASGGPLAQQFLKAGMTANLTSQGSSTHDPGSRIVTSGGPSASDLFAGGGLEVPNDVHTHDVSITFAPADQRPPYTEVIIAKLGPSGCP